MNESIHNFYGELSDILNRGKSRSVMLYGNVNDLFYDGTSFVPLVDFLSKKFSVPRTDKSKGVTQIIYEMDRDIRIIGDEVELMSSWNAIIDAVPSPDGKKQQRFYDIIKRSKLDHVTAIEFLRQLTWCSQRLSLKHNLVIIIEGAESLIPVGNYASLSLADRTKIASMNDWFRDPKFTHGNDSVILIGESRSLVHDSIARLPHLISVEVPSPNLAERRLFIDADKHNVFFNFPEMTAGLSIHALRQLCCDSPTPEDVVDKVEDFICSELGEDVVEFKRPTKTLKDVIGFRKLKTFIREELIPRFLAVGEDALSGAAVSGPIGGGKTFLMEATCAEPDMNMPVLVLKNLRSQYFGQTDVIFEKLRRVLIGIGKVCVFVDEADTMFGGLGEDVHETERRLTGKIQGLMSDPAFRGKVIWLLMSARIHRLSPDIRRPGRAGDLIIPVLDPEGDDARDFRVWCCSVLENEVNVDDPSLIDLTKGYSAASYQALRSRLKAKRSKIHNTEELVAVARDIIPADIGQTRHYQTLQALLNCTSRSLLPETYQGNIEECRVNWAREIASLEAQGIK